MKQRANNITVVVLVLLAVWATCDAAQASAAFLTGMRLLKLCQSSDPALHGQCVAYIAGVEDGVDLERDLSTPQWDPKDVVLKSPRKLWCTPAKTVPQQLASVVIKHLQNHPEVLHNSASSEVGAAFREAFPCTPAN